MTLAFSILTIEVAKSEKTTKSLSVGGENVLVLPWQWWQRRKERRGIVQKLVQRMLPWLQTLGPHKHMDAAK